MHGDAVTPGYWNRPDADAEKWDDGWFRTGDLMSRDADGYLYYVDRIDDMIVTGGENVFPQMVEEHLAELPGPRRGRGHRHRRTSGGWSR